MKHLVRWGIILGMVICSSSLMAAEDAGFLKTTAGDVRIQRSDTEIAGLKGTALLASDILITGKKSYAGIIFKDGTLLTLGPDSRFTLSAYRFEPQNRVYEFSMYLEKGSGLYQSGKIGKLAPQAVNLSTPKATVGIRGTRFIIKVED